MASPHGTHAPGTHSRSAIAAAIVWAGLAALALMAGGAPAPLPADAAPEVASGGRAMGVLERLARGEGERVSKPRPAGSAANAAARERILAECERVGLKAEVDVRYGVAVDEQAAGTVHNVVARLYGRGGLSGPGEAILCMAHYDSVGAGPGIGDDLAGVAAWIETARALRAGPELERDVIFLFEDAEEHGLLGAELFAAQHPWAKDVGFVINLEARGDSGPSRLFETGLGNAWALEAFGRTASAPSTSSVSTELYRRMPNDTDYTVWRTRGVPGLNFACIGDVTRYHTPLDDIEHLSPRTLQHHVTNAHGAVLGMDRATWPARAEDPSTAAETPEDAVFFDLFRRHTVALRVGSMRVIAVIGLMLALLAMGRSASRGVVRARGALFGATAALVAVVSAAGFASGAGAALRALGAADGKWFAHPTPLIAAYFGAGVAGLSFAAMIVGRWVRPAELGSVTAVAGALLGLVLTWVVPGASYLFVFPCFVLAALAAAAGTRGHAQGRWTAASVAALGVAALLWTPIHAGVIGAFGPGAPVPVVAPLAFVGLFALPALVTAAGGASIWITACGLALALGSGALAASMPSVTEDRPGHLNLRHVIDASGEASWEVHGLTTPVPEELFRTLAITLGGPPDAKKAANHPWARLGSFPARDRGEPETSKLEIVRTTANLDGTETVLARMLPASGVDQVLLSARGVLHVRVAGTTMPKDMRWLAPDPEGHEVEFDLPLLRTSAAFVELTDKRFGLTSALAREAIDFLDARPSAFVPAHDGDLMLVESVHVLREGELAEEWFGVPDQREGAAGDGAGVRSGNEPEEGPEETADEPASETSAGEPR